MPLRTYLPRDRERRRSIGERIRSARLAAGIGLRQMGRDIGMSASWVLGVESGEIAVDAVRMADLSRYLGYPAAYFLDDTEYLAERRRELQSRPATRLDWQMMYADEGERAAAHYELDRVFQRLEEERGGGRARSAGGD